MTADNAHVFAGQWPFLREDFVRDALLDVISLTGEELQRLVLGLPSEAADRAVVAIVVERAGNALIVVERGLLIVEQSLVGDGLEQTQSEGRRRDPENNVVVGLLGGEARLPNTARARVNAAGDRVQIFYTAVGRVRV